ncbi:MAG: transglutaminase domain-containing protein [Myxococcota bacterium]
MRIGTERRSVFSEDDETVIVRRRTTWLQLGGTRRAVRGGSRMAGPADGPAASYLQWSPTGSRTWTGAAWLPDAWPPPRSGRWPLVDPFSLEVVTGEVEVDAQSDTTVVRWTGSAGKGEATWDDQGLVRATQGSFTLERGSAPTSFDTFDPVSLYAIPVAAQPRAERALIGRFLVDGVVTRTDAPIWLQIPAVPIPPHPPSEADTWVADAPDARVAIQKLVVHVRQTLDGVPQPGTLDAAEALRAGRGDCDEAAAAFVHLARQLGLEADTVGGVVYREGTVGPALYPHAWATVRLGAQTVAVDPALGQAPADASHLPLGSSASEAAARLSRGVQIAVVELR